MLLRSYWIYRSVLQMLNNESALTSILRHGINDDIQIRSFMGKYIERHFQTSYLGVSLQWMLMILLSFLLLQLSLLLKVVILFLILDGKYVFREVKWHVWAHKTKRVADVFTDL